MASTSPAPFQTGSPSSPTPNNDPSPSSNSLYLFTFLTTLLLLLAVSCGIVLRSFILRRRFRRRVEEAIRAGVLLPEQVEALRRRGPQLGEKPKMWEVYIDGRHKEGYESSATNNSIANDWSDVMPVAATIIPSPSSAPSPDTTTSNTQQQYSAEPAHPRRGLFWFLRRPDPMPSSILPTTAPPPPPSSIPMSSIPPTRTTDPSLPSSEDRVQLTLLIAMPNPNARQYRPPNTADVSTASESKGKERTSVVEPDKDDDEEGEIPEVVFGVTEVPWMGGADWKPEEAATKDVGADEGKEVVGSSSVSRS